MKSDMTTAVIAAIAGTFISYLIVSTLFLQEAKPVPITTLDSSIGSNLDEPSVDVFNYRALNPTVEVYIDCSNYDVQNGSCMDASGEMVDVDYSGDEEDEMIIIEEETGE